MISIVNGYINQVTTVPYNMVNTDAADHASSLEMLA